MFYPYWAENSWQAPAVWCLFLQSIWLNPLLMDELETTQQACQEKIIVFFQKLNVRSLNPSETQYLPGLKLHNRQSVMHSSHLKQMFFWSWSHVKISDEPKRLAMLSLFWTDNRKVRGQSLLLLQITLGCYEMRCENWVRCSIQAAAVEHAYHAFLHFI